MNPRRRPPLAAALALAALLTATVVADDVTEMSNAYALGKQLESQGDYAGALQAHERSMVLAARAFGPQSKQVGMALHNMAEVHSARYEYAQAEALHKRIIAITEARLGRNHVEVAYALSHLADHYQATAQ